MRVRAALAFLAARFAAVVALAVLISSMPLFTAHLPRAEAATVPGAPPSAQAVPFDGYAEVGWGAAADGGSPLTGYTVTVSPGGATVTTAGNVRNTTVTGLTNGTSYTFSVKATNAIGTGSSRSAPAVTVGAPSAYRSAVVADGPSLYYRLGEPGGAAFGADTSGNRRTATVNGVTFGQAGFAVGVATTGALGLGSRAVRRAGMPSSHGITAGNHPRRPSPPSGIDVPAATTGRPAESGSRLAEASAASFRAADDPASMFIKNKHLASAGGNQAKFLSDDISEVQDWVAQGLRSDGVQFLPNGLEGTFRAIVPAGRVIGTRGQSYIRAIVTDDGRVINAFPVVTR